MSSTTKKPKTAIGSVLSQLKNPSLTESSEQKLLKKRQKADKNTRDFDFLSMGQKKQIIALSEIVEIDPEKCVLWKLKDRHSDDLGNIDSLANDIQENGQAQPGIVRYVITDSGIESFEIIVGERRWAACKLKKIKFLVIVKELTDKEAAILQATENLNRKNLSDYSRGMNYSSLIKQGILTQSELQKKLNIPRTTLSDLLSFAQIPDEIINKVEKPTKMSTKVASLIRANSKKGEEYTKAIASFAHALSSGIGANKFNQLLTNALSLSKEQKPLSSKFFDADKNLLFTTKNDGKDIVSVSFPKKVSKQIDMDKLLQTIISELKIQLSSNLTKVSAAADK